MKNKKILCVTGVLAVFIAGVLIGYFGTQTTNLLARNKHPLLASRVQGNNPNEVRVGFSPLRSKLIDYVNSYQDPSIFSVYFEYLPTGTSVTVNPEQEAIAASLIKVPLAMNIFKLIEQGKIDIDATVTLKPEFLDSEYGELYKKGAGYELTIQEAIRYNLSESDNTAMLALWDVYEDAVIAYDDDVFNYLDVDFDLVEDERVLIGPKSYSSILKCLYFACYNSKNHSQEILTYLTESSFNDRLTRYLPDKKKVAHKIGTFSDRFQSDCGIIYATNNNYVLCVMVKGSDPEASKAIADISRIVHIHVNDYID